MKPDDAALVGAEGLIIIGARCGRISRAGRICRDERSVCPVLAHNHLISAIEAELDKLNIQDIHSVEYASRIIKDMIVGGDWPEELMAGILQQFVHLNTRTVAVRSSVYSESGYSTAWAGELVTSLNIGMGSLPEQIKHCWASLYSARSLYHLYQRHVRLQDLSMAVIVQKMVSASVSGMTYTAHPGHRDPGQMVIEAVLGLGEAIVSGKIIPDTYVLRKEPFAVLEKTVTTQSYMITTGDEEGTKTKEFSEPITAQKLTDEQIHQIADDCLRLEDHYGKPLSVEWVFADAFYFVQARPIELE